MRETQRITEIAILVALAVVLELVFSFLPKLPQGGRVSLAMLPLFVIAWRHGFKWGVIGGAVYGLLNLMLDGVLYHWASIFFDYTIAFGVIGFAAFAKKWFGDNIIAFSIGIVVGSILRFISHFISGFLLFGGYAADAGFDSIYLYSLSYNATYTLPTLIITLIVGIAIFIPLNHILNRDT